MESEWNSAQTFERNWWMTNRSEHESEIVKNNLVARMLLIDKGLPSKSVIDIGCGTGGQTMVLASELSGHITALDSNAASLASLQRQIKSNPSKLRGDIDNYAKSVLDGLNGVAYTDDKQIVSLELRKL
jgi:cyclopropane fatty-acyl-phospholipid synthase-like methyltransferase